MTDTTTIDRPLVDATIAALRVTLDRATARLGDEEREYNAKRDAMVEVAHRRGTENSIGEALDDLLEEFGLARRAWRGTFRALIQVTGQVNPRGAGVSLASGVTMYPTHHMTVTSPFGASVEATIPDGHEGCACDFAADNIRRWLRENYGAPTAETMRFRVGRMYCRHPGCPHDDFYPDASDGASVNWHEFTEHVVGPVS